MRFHQSRLDILLIFALILILTSSLSAQYFGQNKVQYKEFKWHYIRSEHFDVYFYPGGYQIATFTANEAESSYVKLKEDFKYEITDRVSIILYKSHNDFQQTNVVDVYLVEGIGGVTELYKNRVVIPFEGSLSQLRHVLHHELVHAVMNDMLYGGSVQSLISGQVAQVPTWFAEGLAEYFSLRWDTRIDMVVRDATISGYMPPISYLSYYLAYQGGASVFRYIAEKYGHQKISEILHKIKGSLKFEGAFKSALGIKMDELTEDWQKDLRKKYWPDIVSRKESPEIARAVTDHNEWENYINLSPALSPNGDKMVFLSDKDGKQSVYLMDILDNSIVRRLVKGETSVNFEELHWLSPGMDWSPDGKKVTLSAKAGDQDALYIIDVETDNIEQYKFDIDGIFSAAWSPRGDQIAFVGNMNGQSDIYVFNIKTDSLVQITDDRFTDAYPSWSNDGERIAFVSDRGPYLSEDQLPENFILNSHEYENTDIYIVNYQNKQISRITNTFNRESDPVFSPDSKKLLYVSEEFGISNIYIHNIDSSKAYPVTNLLTGAFQLSLDKDGKTLAFVSFLEGGWDIYTLRNPFDLKPVSIEPTLFAKQLKEKMALEEADESIASSDSNRVDVSISPFSSESAVHQSSASDFSKFVFADLDRRTDVKKVDVKLDKDKYQEDDGHYKVWDYKVKFSPDLVDGAAQYNTLWGFQGFTQLAFSDVLGNHKIYLGTNLVFDLKNSYLAAQYWYLSKRIDFGISGFHYANTYISYSDLVRYRNYGFVGIMSRPFNKFTRVDFSLYWFNVVQEYLTRDVPERTIRSILPSLQLVHDTSEWGITGPIDGFRGAVSATYSPAYSNDSPEFLTVNTDLRQYIKLSDYYSFAFRLTGGSSFGANPQKYFLGGMSNWLNRKFKGNILIDNISDVYFSEFVTPLRGARYYERTGNTFVLTNLEFRFPLIPYIQLGFPPIRMGNIQGLLFTDIGTAWDRESPFRGIKNGRLEDVVAGYGFGVRLAFIFWIRYDLAWRYDLVNSGQPMQYWSLGYDF
ncbi:MAG: PD40 domain-containing protein [Calditrichaceae bacterium]|nr:PD40 domain-containing protein [Calditrichaceae bacterium]